MHRLLDLKIWAVLVIVLASCQKLRPDSVRVPEYPDLAQVIEEQADLLDNTRAKKEVWLDGKSEIQVLNMDSTKWAKELSFLKEINPNQPEYIGAFEKSGDEENLTLTLEEGENGALKKAYFFMVDDNYERITASFHEDKDVYIHHRDFEITFEDGTLTSAKIEGYQQMMFKDTVKFRITINVHQ